MRKAKGDARWHELTAELPLRPIRDAAGLDRAVAMLDRLIDLPRLSAEEEDYRTVLGDLIRVYEEVHCPMDDVPAGRMLASLIESKGVTQAAVAEATGASRATITQVIKGNRKPGRRLMAALGDYFAVDPSVFL